MEALGEPSGPDVIARLLDSVRVRSTVYCRSTMRAPWGFAVEAHGNPSFHVVTRGSCWLEVDDDQEPLQLGEGDLVVVPRGPRHALRDSPGSPTQWLDEILAGTPRDGNGRLRYGGDGAATELICGGFLLQGDGADPLLEALPSVIEIRGSDGAPVPWVRVTLELIGAVTAADGPGTEAVLTRLADSMLTQVLRVALISLGASDPARTTALRDPQIAKAVELMHREPDREWTVSGLAAAVAYSRSAFAARFREIVGESPMSYLARTRLAIAATQLDRTNATLAEIARGVGYASVSSFSRAFKRAFGVAPGVYRTKPAQRPVELTVA